MALAPVIDQGNPVNRSHPLNRSRVAWWLALPQVGATGYGSPTWRDLAGRNPGTLTGGPPWRGGTRPGGWGSLLFDGSAGCVAGMKPPISDGTRYSLGLWMQSTDASASTHLLATQSLSTQHTAASFLGVRLNTGQISARWQDSTATANLIVGSATNFADGVWHRAVAVANGSTLTLYVDGVSRGTPGTLSGSPAAADTFELGRFDAASGLYYAGRLDDVSAWSRALSAAEVKADYDLSRAGYPGVLNWARPLGYAAAAVAAPLFRRGLTRRTGSRSPSPFAA